MTTAHILAAYVGACIVGGYFLHRAAQKRAAERRVTAFLHAEGLKAAARRAEVRNMPLHDACAHIEAQRLDAEWNHLATLALTDWPALPAELPRTW